MHLKRPGWTLLLATLLLAACGITAPAAPPLRPDIREAAELIHQQAGSHRIILLGESHGTVEPPQLASALMRRYLASEPVRLGLEVPSDTQPALDKFLTSAGSASDRSALMHAGFWMPQTAAHDGRRNHDSLDMIDVARQLRAVGADIAVFAFDPGSTGEHHQRSRRMGDAIRARHLAEPDARLLIVTGNVHAMRKRPGYAPPEMQTPMGADLADLAPFSVRIDARGGEIQACRPEGCGPWPLPDTPQRRSGPGSDGVYDLIVVLERSTRARMLGPDAAD